MFTLSQTSRAICTGDWARFYQIMNNATNGTWFQGVCNLLAGYMISFREDIAKAYRTSGMSLGVRYSPMQSTLERRQYYPFFRSLKSGKKVRRSSRQMLAVDMSMFVSGKLADSIALEFRTSTRRQTATFKVAPMPQVTYRYIPRNPRGGKNEKISAARLATWFEFGSPGGHIKARPIWQPMLQRYLHDPRYFPSFGSRVKGMILGYAPVRPTTMTVHAA